MKSLLIITLVSLLLVSVAISVEKTTSPLKAALGEEKFVACGLDRLEPEEQEHLHGLIFQSPEISWVEESAVRHLIKEGFEEIHVVGAIDHEDHSHERLLLVMHNYEIYTMDPPLGHDLPEPGRYLAKIGSAHWTILLRNGEEASYWTKDVGR